MKLIRCPTFILLCLAAVLVSACVRTSEGVPVAGEAGPGGITSSPPSATTGPTPEADPSMFGVVPTSRAPVPPNAATCTQKIKPAVRSRLDGPRGMQATVTIAQTQLDPAAAFRKYADDLMAESAVSSVSVLPGELCGYSGQKLMGAWSDTPQNAVQYQDRMVHIWTNSGNNYLVAVHVQAPTGTPGFDPAAEVLTEDFEIVLP